MTVEERAAELASTSDPVWSDKLGERIAALPDRPRALIEPLCQVLLRPNLLVSPRPFLVHQEQFAALDAASAEDRRAIFGALHPELAPALSLWWERALDMPYGIDSEGAAYRSVGSPAHTFERRAAELSAVVSGLGPYPREIGWVNEWAAYIPWYSGYRARSVSDAVGALVGSTAASTPKHSDQLFDDLLAAVRNAPGTTLSRHVVDALLQSGRPEGLDAVLDLLRSDSLDQGTFEMLLGAAGHAPVDKFCAIVRIVVENKLIRSYPTHRATRIGFGLQTPANVQLLNFIADPSAAHDALGSDDLKAMTVALHATAIVDVDEAITRAQALAASDLPPNQVVGIKFLRRFPVDAAKAAVLPYIDDVNIELALRAHAVGQTHRGDKSEPALGLDAGDYYQRSVRLIQRLAADPDQEEALARVCRHALKYAAERPLDPFVPHMHLIDEAGHRLFATHARRLKDETSDDVRQVLIGMLLRRDTLTRSSARRALEATGVSDNHVAAIEALLKRKSPKLRQECLALLSSLDPDRALVSADRLWASRSGPQSDAACALLASIESPAAVKRAAVWASEASPEQLSILRPILNSTERTEEPETDDQAQPASNLPLPAPVELPQPLRSGKVKPIVTPAAARLVVALDELIYEQRDVEIEFVGYSGTQRGALTEAKYLADPIVLADRTSIKGRPEMVHGDFFRSWFEGRPCGLRSSIGDEALRALCALRPIVGGPSVLGARLAPADSVVGRAWLSQRGHTVTHVRHVDAMVHVLGWLTFETATGNGVDDLIDASIRHAVDAASDTSGQRRVVPPGFAIVSELLKTREDLATPERMARVWAYLCWSDLHRSEQSDSTEPRRERHALCLTACDAGAVPSAEFEDLLLDGFGPLWYLTSGSPQLWRDHPNAMPAAERATHRIIDAELTRGDLAQPTTGLVIRISSFSGAGRALAALGKLGNRKITRDVSYFAELPVDSLSHLLRVSRPDSSDTPELVRELAHELELTDHRLTEFAMYSPQWASLIESAIAWPGLDSAIHWIHAHTKEANANDSEESLEAWFSPLVAHTDLSADQLLDGSIDVAWFRSSHATLGHERWQVVQSVAKLATMGNGHLRAQLFSDVLTGELSEADCAARITDKRHQDAVRAYGLAPLPNGAKAREAAIRKRYRFLYTFEAQSSQSGPQRRVSERRATATAIENLARNAGFTNTLRFRWSMELDELVDLVDGSLHVVEGGVDVGIEVDDDGTAHVAVERAGKTLKSIPAPVKKKPAVKALLERHRELAAQVKRIRGSLEHAMTLAERFEPSDLQTLRQHPLVGPSMAKVVFADERGVCMRLNGDHLRSAANRTVKAKGSIRVAHPHDLLRSGHWELWQHWLFEQRIRQPFRQVFREHYAVAQGEAAEPAARRFAGHQVQARQTHTLLVSRGWTFDHEERMFHRPFRRVNTMARLSFEDGYFATDANFPAVDAVEFTQLRSRNRTALGQVDPIVFSEAMRDLDLVVSVAHASNIAIDASESTIGSRTDLARELLQLLSVDNVELSGKHAIVTGSRGRYRIHLGSGEVHEAGTGHLFALPERQQHQGALFLPFVDDDPRTTEVLSKILVFADDAQITDQSILRQLRPKR